MKIRRFVRKRRRKAAKRAADQRNAARSQLRTLIEQHLRKTPVLRADGVVKVTS